MTAPRRRTIDVLLEKPVDVGGKVVHAMPTLRPAADRP
jgi:hypothetical protein